MPLQGFGATAEFATAEHDGELIHVLVATDLTVQAPTFGAPALEVHVILAAANLTVQAPAFASSVLNQDHVLAAENLTVQGPVFEAPPLSVNVVSEVLLGDRTIDFGLAALDQECDRIYMCSDQPTDYAETLSLALGSKALDAGAVFAAPEAGTPDGRKTMSVLITDGDITLDGSVTYWSAVDTVNSRFLASGPVNAPRAVWAGQKFRLDAFAVRLPTSI